MRRVSSVSSGGEGTLWRAVLYGDAAVCDAAAADLLVKDGLLVKAVSAGNVRTRETVLHQDAARHVAAKAALAEDAQALVAR